MTATVPFRFEMDEAGRITHHLWMFFVLMALHVGGLEDILSRALDATGNAAKHQSEENHPMDHQWVPFNGKIANVREPANRPALALDTSTSEDIDRIQEIISILLQSEAEDDADASRGSAQDDSDGGGRRINACAEASACVSKTLMSQEAASKSTSNSVQGSFLHDVSRLFELRYFMATAFMITAEPRALGPPKFTACFIWQAGRPSNCVVLAS